MNRPYSSRNRLEVYIVSTHLVFTLDSLFLLFIYYSPVTRPTCSPLTRPTCSPMSRPTYSPVPRPTFSPVHLGQHGHQ